MKGVFTEECEKLLRRSTRMVGVVAVSQISMTWPDGKKAGTLMAFRSIETERPLPVVMDIRLNSSNHHAKNWTFLAQLVRHAPSLTFWQTEALSQAWRDSDPAPDVPSFISRVRSPYAPAWGGMQKLLG